MEPYVLRAVILWFSSLLGKQLQDYGRPKIFEYFVLDWKGVQGGGREPKADTGRNTEGTEESNEKQAKRLAIINERETVWDLIDDGIGIEIKGDSFLITSWLNGQWTVSNKQYQCRIDKCVQDIYQQLVLGLSVQEEQTQKMLEKK